MMEAILSHPFVTHCMQRFNHQALFIWERGVLCEKKGIWDIDMDFEATAVVSIAWP